MKAKRLKRAGLLKTPMKGSFSFLFLKVSFSVSIKELISRVLKVGVGALLISPQQPTIQKQPLQLEKMSRENEGEAAACHLSHRSIVCDRDQMPLMCVN